MASNKVNNIFRGKFAALYMDFIDRYADNLVDYILDHCRFTPTFQQMEVVEAIQKPGSRVAVASGHGTGKSFLSAWTIDWALRTQPGSNTLLTATNINQAKSSIWKYLESVIADVEKIHPWMRGVFVKQSSKYYNVFFKDSHWAIPKTASKDRPEGLAGFHADDFLIVCDEASGIPDENFSVMRGALTQKRNRMLMISQPTRPVGHFAEAMTTLAKKTMPDGSITGIYETFTLNSEDSPLVSREFIREKLLEYGGHHSPLYQIRVLGCLPDNLSGYLIPKKWCEDCQHYTITHPEAWGWVLTVDVAEGVHRDSSVATMGRVSGYGPERRVEVEWCEEYLDKNEKDFARQIASWYYEYPALTIAVDGDGAGRTVYLELEELGIPSERIHWGLPPHAKADQKRYTNQRAYAHLKLREAIFEERFKGPTSKKFVAQASKLPYSINERGQYSMMPKEKMRSEGIKSPDISDTCCFFFLADYIPCEGLSAHATEEDDFLKMAREAMGDA